MKTGGRHPSRADLVEFLEGGSSVDLEGIARHLRGCAACADVRNDLLQVQSLLADPLVWEPPPRDDQDFGKKLQGIIADVRRVSLEEERAKETWRKLRGLPVGDWIAFLDKAPDGVKSEGLVNRIILESDAELDRGPIEALPWLNVAFQIAGKLSNREHRNDCLARVLKNISTGLVLSGDFRAALEAVDAGEQYALESRLGGFVYAELRSARAGILMRMGAYVDALPVAREAALRFAEFGETRRVAQCRTIEGCILCGQGDFAEALRVGRTIQRTFSDVGGTDRDIATVSQLIGAACFRLGRFDEASEAKADALLRFSRLGDVPETLRAEWTLAAIMLLKGDSTGLSQLRRVAARYKELGMKGDSGFVQLSIAEELIRREDWEEAERVAADAARALADSGARLFHVQALALLRDSIAGRTATPRFVADLRSYIEQNNPTSPFKP